MNRLNRDPEKRITEKLNHKSVNIDPLDKSDFEQLLQLIIKHKQYTKSKIASFIFTNWELERQNFIKIMPEEYKKALIRLAEEQPITEEFEALEGALEGN